MSGHSKWATTKYRKGAQDKARAKIFAKCIRQVEVAAREGGGDIDGQRHPAHLSTRRPATPRVPLDTIEKAIKRGTGELEGVRYESINYEGYAPAGVAIMVECLTDNRNRTGAEIRNLFSKNGGDMAEPGRGRLAVRAQGIVIAVPRTIDEDKVMEIAMEGGAEDMADDGERLGRDQRPGGRSAAVRPALDGAGITPESVRPVHGAHHSVAGPRRRPRPRRSCASSRRIDDHDDVQAVHANFDIPDEVLAAFEG